MENMLIYNPNCSKSQKALELLTERGVKIRIFDYQEDTLTEQMLRDLCEYLDTEPIKLMRIDEDILKEMNLTLKDVKNEVYKFKLLCQYPILLQRPIFVYNGKAVIGRPPQRVLEILPD